MASSWAQSLPEDLFPCISRGVQTQSLYMASPCVKSWPGRFVSLYITQWSNIELEYVKILAVDIDDYFDPKIITFDKVFIASLLSFLLEIILSHLVIFLIHIIWSFEEEKTRESPGESEWAECFSGFMFTLWWVVFTRYSLNRAGECIWWSEFCDGKSVRDYTGCVICRLGDLVKGVFVRRGDLVKGRSLGVTRRRRRRLRGSRSLV